jgi:hypothetical protein
MNHLPTYSDFILGPPIAFDGNGLRVGQSIVAADGYSGIIVSREMVNGQIMFRDHLGVHHLVEACDVVIDEAINEDLQWWEVTKGILAADAIKSGMAIAGGGLAVAALMFSNWFHNITSKMATARKDAKLKAAAEAIAVKFNEDTELNGMMKKLQQFPYMKPLMASKREAAKIAANNKERSKVLREIAKYVKSKLTPEETEFFVEVNKILKSQPLATNDGEKVEEDLQQMADAVLDPSNSNAESSINKDPNRTVGTGTYTSTTSDPNPTTKGLFKTTDSASGGWSPFLTTSN